jgi:lipopolysaccharide export system protein LptA
MRFTIERIRTLVLAAGVLLVLALIAFLAVGKWRTALGGHDLPRKLGKNIVQEASGVTYMQSHGGHMLFRIHASRAEELQNSRALLHDVHIEFFSKDGNSIDSITGSDFEYDQKTGVGTAQGSVEITLSRPPAMRQKNTPNLPDLPQGAASVHVKTSGLTFNQNTGVLTTAKKVDFRMANGSGSAVGAKYDSQRGYLVLDHAVEVTTDRGGRKVVVHAQHAEFERETQTARLANAETDFKTGRANAGLAKILFRGDGTAQRLDATNGFTLTTAGGGHVTAPVGMLDFGEHNVPRSGRLQGGVKLNSVSAARQLLGTAPDAQLNFSPAGELSLLTLNQGAEIRSDTLRGAGAQAQQVSRTWRSPVAQVHFRQAANGGIEPTELYGSGGVVVTSKTRRGNAAPVPARLAAQEVTGKFGPGGELMTVEGTGHATMTQTLADGAQQTASGDRIEAQFAQIPQAADNAGSARSASAEIHSAVLDGHVVMVQTPLQKAGAQPPPPLRATAGKATYENEAQRLQLTQSPRIEDGGLNLTANTIDILQQAGEAFARGDVKATWLGTDPAAGPNHAAVARAAAPEGVALSGQTPAHAVADEAQFNQAAGEAIFRGHARLWQDANSIAAPEIVLNRIRQTLVARSQARREPVRAVLLGTRQAAEEMAPALPRNKPAGSAVPSVIRVRGSQFTYDDTRHQAVMTGGTWGQVVAEAGGATCQAQQVTLLLRPRGSANESTQVERVTASGNVVVTSEGREGAGARLVYSSLTGEYALTGTPEQPPRLTDPARGTVTGAALIFNSRNDSVSIEGRGRETRTETTAPR